MVSLLVNIDISPILLGLIMTVFIHPLMAFPSSSHKTRENEIFGLSYKTPLPVMTFKLDDSLRSHVFLRNPNWAIKGEHVNLERGESKHPTHHTPSAGLLGDARSAVSIRSGRIYTSDISGRRCSALAALSLVYCSPEASRPGFISQQEKKRKKKKPLLFSSMLFCLEMGNFSLLTETQ